MKQTGEERPFFFGDLQSFAVQARRVQVRIPAGMSTKGELLDFIAVTLGFPYFGNNWDALEDCLTDLSWLPSYQVIVTHEDVPLQSETQNSAIYLDVLRHAIAYWKARKEEHELVIAFPRECEGKVRELLSSKS